VLEECLQNNPDNQNAKKGLATLKSEEAKRGNMPDEKPEYVSIHDRQREIDTKRKGIPIEPVTIHVPAEQIWLHHVLSEQKKTLDSINGKLTFFVVIMVLSILVSILVTCNSLLRSY
jgi:ethanolamine utilization cobalamin adenosyltransferase